jgi:hypothetical protein
MGAHTLKAPVQLQPVSTMQESEQPSAANLFPSSHCSDPEIAPSPQRPTEAMLDEEDEEKGAERQTPELQGQGTEISVECVGVSQNCSESSFVPAQASQCVTPPTTVQP